MQNLPPIFECCGETFRFLNFEKKLNVDMFKNAVSCSADRKNLYFLERKIKSFAIFMLKFLNKILPFFRKF